MAGAELPFELTNCARRAFGLQPVERSWKTRRIESRNGDACVKIYFAKNRIRKWIHVISQRGDLHTTERDVDLETEDEGISFRPAGSSSKHKPVRPSTRLGTTAGFLFGAHLYPGLGIAQCRVEHPLSKRVVLRSGYVDATTAQDLIRWIDSAQARMGSALAERIAVTRGLTKSTRLATWKVGQIIAVEVANDAWVFVRLLLPIAALKRLLPDDPMHDWARVMSSHWWAVVLQISPSVRQPTLSALQSAPRLQLGLFAPPEYDDGRHSVVGHWPLTSEELAFEEGFIAESRPPTSHLSLAGSSSTSTLVYDWGLARLRLPPGTSVDALDPPPVTSHLDRPCRFYVLERIERRFREGARPMTEAELFRDCPGESVRLMHRRFALNAAGFDRDIEYDALCTQLGAPTRSMLVELVQPPDSN